jgi:hypothetical protein
VKQKVHGKTTLSPLPESSPKCTALISLSLSVYADRIERAEKTLIGYLTQEIWHIPVVSNTANMLDIR